MPSRSFNEIFSLTRLFNERNINSFLFILIQIAMEQARRIFSMFSAAFSMAAAV